MTFYLGKSSLANMSLVHPKLVFVVKKAITLTDVDFGIMSSGGGRTAEDQKALFKKGVTQKDGYKKKSNHQTKTDGWGHAVDCVAWVDGKWEQDDWEPYFHIASAMSKASKLLKTDIKWGGNWYDPMSKYGSEVADMKSSVERYKEKHPGKDFIDGPHFELV